MDKNWTKDDAVKKKSLTRTSFRVHESLNWGIGTPFSSYRQLSAGMAWMASQTDLNPTEHLWKKTWRRPLKDFSHPIWWGLRESGKKNGIKCLNVASGNLSCLIVRASVLLSFYWRKYFLRSLHFSPPLVSLLTTMNIFTNTYDTTIDMSVLPTQRLKYTYRMCCPFECLYCLNYFVALHVHRKFTLLATWPSNLHWSCDSHARVLE